MKKTIICCMFLLFSSASAQEKTYKNYVHHVLEGRKAEQNKDYHTALRHFKKVTKITPYDPKRYYEISAFQARLHQTDAAAENLARSLMLGFDPGDELDPVFSDILEHPRFPEIRKMLEDIKKPVCNSRAAFTLPEKDLIPEGMAYDKKDGSFYFGSIWKCKIIKVDKQGNVSDFTSEKQDGMRVILGMEVDAQRRELWVASAVGSARPDISDSEIGWSGIFRYSINTGLLIHKYTIREDSVYHFFNDLTITPAGDVFITDTYDGSVYRVSAASDRLELYLKDEALIYPNGICTNGNADALYLSSSGDGVYKIDIATKERFLLAHHENISMYGIDGMYFYDNSLVCIQNGLQRVSRFYLDEEGNSVLNMEIIESRNPVFNWPTTGAVVDDSFYYIGNSQIRSFNPDGSVFPPEKLDEVVILRTELD